MVQTLKIAIAAVAALLAAEILTAFYVGHAVAVEQPKIAAKGQCYMMDLQGVSHPCGEAYKDFDKWVVAGKEV
jgi:hypothetical protein